MRTVVYVDGYNLYYGLLRGTKLKWLDLVALFESHVLSPEAELIHFNEKKSDVNLAADLISGAWTDAYEQAVVCSNDTDLEAALETVRTHHPTLRLGVVAPVPGSDHRYIAGDLKQHAHWAKPLSMTHVSRAQLPDRIPASAIHKPLAWG